MKNTRIGDLFKAKCVDCDWERSDTNTAIGGACTVEYFTGIVFAHIELTGHTAFVSLTSHSVAHPDGREIDTFRMMQNLDASIREDGPTHTP